MARDSLLDDWADRGISGGLRHGPVARRPVRAEAGEPARLAQDGLHRRGGGGDPLLHCLLSARSPEGYYVLHLRAEPHVVLGLRRRLHARSFSHHMGALGTRRSDRVGRLLPGDLALSRCRGAGAAAVLLPQSRCRMVPRETNQRRAWRLIQPACETAIRWHRCLWIAVALASVVPVSGHLLLRLAVC